MRLLLDITSPSPRSALIITRNEQLEAGVVNIYWHLKIFILIIVHVIKYMKEIYMYFLI